MEKALVGVIGGSGLYEMEGIENIKEVSIETPFGKPSDVITVGDIAGVKCAFLPRHGRGHRILPSEINGRANIYALKMLGVESILSISSCGSLKEEIKPRDFVIPDQIFDGTKGRVSTFFGEGIVGHVGFANPFCRDIRDIVHKAVGELGLKHHFGGTYTCMEGPQFSTKAESENNRKAGFSIIGMTAVPEAKLAREAEICYATIALVTDYDVWKEGEEVTLETVIANSHANVANSKKLIKMIVPKIVERKRECECSKAAAFSVVTDPSKIDRKTYEKIKLIIGKYVK